MSFDESKVQSVYFAALERSSPAERGNFLESACGGDADLRRRVEQLLAAQPRVGEFLKADSAASVATMIVSGGEEVGTTIGPYKLREVLGEGGMGTVYAAEQEHPVRRKVALKVIKPGMDSREVIARFEAERQALALMDHPNIAKVLDAGTTGTGVRNQGSGVRTGPVGEHLLTPDSCPLTPASGRPYFVMELVRGIPITDYCDKCRLDPRQRLGLFVQVCRAVQHAHQKGVIHRDLKPSNVLVTLHDGTPVPKIIDFGVAKAINQRLTEHTVYTRVAQMVGTPLYMSPEQAELSALDVDTRSDVYSLGVLLYELLTGTTPIARETMSKVGFDEMRRIIREDEPPRPSLRVSTLDADLRSTVSGKRGIDERRFTRLLAGELDWIVMKALEKDRTRRYESASAFAADVQRYLDDEPVEACPPSAAYRLRKFARRNRRGLWTGICVAAAVIGIAMIPLSSSVVRRSRDAATRSAAEGSLTSARTALEAHDLVLAERHLAEARAVLASAGHVLSEPAEQLQTLQIELAERRDDAETFARFVPLAQDAQSRIGYSFDGQLAAETLAREALETYGILSDADWTAKLDRRHLTQQQKQEVLTNAYETLLALADSLVRWNATEEKARESLKILSIAEKHHAPTKGLHWIRHRCRETLGDAAASQDEWKKYDSTPATVPLDYYLPGHTAGWEGNLTAAIEAYQQALRLKPDHFNSHFFLASRLLTEKRFDESIAYFTACIALRPDHVYPFLNRAEAYEVKGDLQSARADFVAAAATNAKLAHVVDALRHLVDFYRRTHQVEKERETVTRMISVTTQLTAGSVAMPAHKEWITIKDIGSVGQNLVAAGAFAQAVPILERALRFSEQFLGPDDDQTLFALNNLGVAQQHLKRLPEAIRNLEESTARRRKSRGNKHPQTLVSLRHLGSAYVDDRQFAKAHALFSELLELEREVHGPEHKDFLDCLHRIARAYSNEGQYEKAASAYADALEAHRHALGPDDPTTLNVTHDLASAFINLDRPREAIPMLEEVVAKERTLSDRRYREPWNSLRTLAFALMAAGQIDQTIPPLQEALDLSKEIQGAEHRETLELMTRLGCAYAESGDHEKGLALLESALELRTRTLGAEHNDTLGGMTNLGIFYVEAGRFAEGLKLLERVLEIHRKLRGASDASSVAAMRELVRAYALAGRADDTERLARELDAATPDIAGGDDVERARSLGAAAAALIDVDKFDAAEPLARECLQIRETKSPDSWFRFSAQSVLGGVLLGQKKYAEAEPLLAAGYEGLSQREPTDGVWHFAWQINLRKSRERLVKLYELTMRPEEAARWKETLSRTDTKPPAP